MYCIRVFRYLRAFKFIALKSSHFHRFLSGVAGIEGVDKWLHEKIALVSNSIFMSKVSDFYGSDHRSRDVPNGCSGRCRGHQAVSCVDAINPSPLDNLEGSLQVTFSKAFLLYVIFINNKSALVEVEAWWRIGHYLNQCWPSSLTHVCVTRGRWVNCPWHSSRMMSFISNRNRSMLSR